MEIKEQAILQKSSRQRLPISMKTFSKGLIENQSQQIAREAEIAETEEIPL